MVRISKVGFGASSNMYILVLVPKRTSIIPAAVWNIWAGQLVAWNQSLEGS
jgi:hypothetical protein